MIYGQLTISSDERLREIQRFHAHLQRLETDALTDAVQSQTMATLKGMFFVHLYGYVEFTVSQAVQILLQEIGGLHIAYSHCESVFHSVVLDAEFRSVTDKTSREKRWSSRCQLLRKQHSSGVCEPVDTLFADSLQSTGYKTLQDIFAALNVSLPPVPDPRHIGKINELKERRHEVAHGRASPGEVGSAFSVPDLKDRMDSVEAVVHHILDTLEAHYQSRGFIMPVYHSVYP